MIEIFAYESIKRILVYCAFGWFAGMSLCGYVIIVTAGVKWIVKNLKRHIGKKNAEEESDHE